MHMYVYIYIYILERLGGSSPGLQHTGTSRMEHRTHSQRHTREFRDVAFEDVGSEHISLPTLKTEGVGTSCGSSENVEIRGFDPSRFLVLRGEFLPVDRERHTQRQRETEKQRNRDTGTQRRRDAETQRHRDTDRQTDRHTHTHTQRHTKTQTYFKKNTEKDKHKHKHKKRERERDTHTHMSVRHLGQLESPPPRPITGMSAKHRSDLWPR